MKIIWVVAAILHFGNLAVTERWDYSDENRLTWNKLTGTFGKFNDLPMEENDARSRGWTLIADNCKDKSGPFFGRRYLLKNDRATILIFDVNGHIAGTQMAFKKSLMNPPPRKYAGAYQTLGDFVYITAYFTEPRKVCDKYSVQYSDIVGDKLMFLAGRDKYLIAPLENKNIESTKWVKGNCVMLMGTHYWYDISDDMNCADNFPFLLLYNTKGQLHAFVYVLTGIYVDSPRVEHLPLPVFPKFPTCASKFAHHTTQHVYLTKIGRKTHGC